MKKFWCGLGLLVALGPSAQAQVAFDFYGRGPYRAEVARPSTLNGYEPGNFQTPHGQVVRVLERIAASAPDRVRLLEQGETWEHRKLYLVVVSAPENINRLGEIKSNLAQLADPRRTTPATAKSLAQKTPVVVWLNFGIHGNESASYETVQQVVYQLAASENPQTLALLKNVVVVINPMHNPDGHERFAVWENSVAVGDPESFSLEHDEPYQIYGRLNHYRFDMNRDMLALTQPENKMVVDGVRTWHPQVFADFHGQVANYFFPPAAEPVNKNLVLDKTRRWNEIFGQGNGKAFDRFGWNYYVRHVFDLYYAGYMDSWSSLNGATGMTYETDAGGPRSLLSKLDDDTLLTFRQGIAKHYTTALATLETAAQHREERLLDYYDFFKSGMAEGRTEPLKRVILAPEADPGRTEALVQNLLRKGIEVQIAQKAFSTRVHSYLGGEAKDRTFAAGSFIIDLDQPQKRLAKAQLEPDADLDKGFIQQELERRQRNEQRGKNVSKEEYEFYDVTAWSLPMAWGLDAYWSEDAPTIASTSLNFTNGDIAPNGGGVIGGRANSAYLIPYGPEATGVLACALLQEDFKVAVSTRQLNANGRDWPAGTLLVRTSRNPESLHQRIEQLARQLGVSVYAVNSSYSSKGDTGIGSENIISLKRPKVAVVWDEATEPTSYGSLWYTLERTYHLGFTPVSVKALSATNLNKFNVVVLPDGDSDRYQELFGKEGITRLKAWVEQGGVLIGLGGGAELFTLKDVDLTSSRAVGDEEPPKPRPLALPGAAFRAHLDPHHFLSYGYSPTDLVVLLRGSTFLKPSKAGANVVTFPQGKLAVAGFEWPNNTENLLHGTSYLIDEPTGDGHVILFADDPNFRYLWRTASRLLLNGILFAPALR